MTVLTDSLGVRVKRHAQRPFQPAFVAAAARSLHRRILDARTIDECLDLVYGFDAYGITIVPGQVRSEIKALLELLGDAPPRRILEVGTWSGGSLFLFARVAAPDAHLISIDLPAGEFGGGYPAWKAPLYRSFAAAGQRIDLLRVDSHDPATLAEVQRLLEGDALDFLFIDGDHTFEGVRRDFDAYSPLVRSGGLVALHDIAEPAAGGPMVDEDGSVLLVGDVPRYWRSVRDRYESFELVHAPRGCFGIGVVRV